jgi:hypothetical protein
MQPADLLAAKRDCGAGGRVLDCLQRRDDPERAVEAAAVRHGVEPTLASTSA